MLAFDLFLREDINVNAGAAKTETSLSLQHPRLPPPSRFLHDRWPCETRIAPTEFRLSSMRKKLPRPFRQSETHLGLTGPFAFSASDSFNPGGPLGPRTCQGATYRNPSGSGQSVSAPEAVARS